MPRDQVYGSWVGANLAGVLEVSETRPDLSSFDREALMEGLLQAIRFLQTYSNEPQRHSVYQRALGIAGVEGLRGYLSNLITRAVYLRDHPDEARATCRPRTR